MVQYYLAIALCLPCISSSIYSTYNLGENPPTFIADYDTWSDASDCNTARNTDWLTPKERKLICEINMVRTNPQRYVKYAEEYYALVQRPKNKQIAEIHDRYTYDSWGSRIVLGQDTVFSTTPISPIIAAERAHYLADIAELISELRTATPQKTLQPSTCLTEAAREQGYFCKEQAHLTHGGRDGQEFDVRLKSYCGEMNYGGETIAGGAGSARQTVLNWLIDAGLPTRNHRKILMHTTTKRIGIFHIGRVGDLRNSWVCNFAE
jgi:uncharacterized protein YkwD